MPDPGQLAATLGTLVVAAPAALVAALGLPSLLGRPLTERANYRACRWAIALGLVAAVGVLGLMLSTGDRHVVVDLGNWAPVRHGAGRSWKKATSSALERPTSSHPMNSVSIVSASDAVTIPRRNTANSTKNRLYPGSRCMKREANAPTVPQSTNERMTSGTDSRSNSNFTAKC